MRLVHQTFLVLAAVVLIAVVATAALFALTLERGFVAYVNARQQEQFATLQRLVTETVTRTGSLEALSADEALWRRLLRRSAPADQTDQTGQGDQAAQIDDAGTGQPPREGREPPPATYPPPLQRPPPFDPASPRAERPPRAGGPPGPLPGPPPIPPGRGRELAGGPPPRQGPYGLGQNVDLLDAAHDPVFALRRPPGAHADPVERAITVGGRTVGWLRLWPLRRVDRPEDVAFLRGQYAQIAWGAGALVLLMLGVAPLLARRVTQPLSRITAATARIARGDLAVDLATTRQDEIGTLMKNVSGMAAALAQLEQARRRWIAEISHELRTPLTVLQAELEALAVGVRPLDPAAVASLQEETRHLTRLVEDLHQLALADLGALPCTMASVELAELVRRVVSRFAQQAARKGLQLEVRLPSQPVPLRADAQRLEQLLGNLLQNSVRYTDAPGRIVVCLDATAQWAKLVVEDSAPGVAAADCERLFDPLYRADAARSRKNGGSGLGLAICRAVAQAHDGRITAAPSVLGGLMVTTTLPRAT